MSATLILKCLSGGALLQAIDKFPDPLTSLDYILSRTDIGLSRKWRIKTNDSWQLSGLIVKTPKLYAGVYRNFLDTTYAMVSNMLGRMRPSRSISTVNSLVGPSSTNMMSNSTSPPLGQCKLRPSPALPVELLLQVVKETTDPATLLALTLTSSLFFHDAEIARNNIQQHYRIFLPARYIEQRTTICSYLGFSQQPSYHAIACDGNSWFFDVRIPLERARTFKARWPDAQLRLLECDAEYEDEPIGSTLLFDSLGWKRLAFAKYLSEARPRLRGLSV